MLSKLIAAASASSDTLTSIKVFQQVVDSGSWRPTAEKKYVLQDRRHCRPQALHSAHKYMLVLLAIYSANRQRCRFSSADVDAQTMGALMSLTKGLAASVPRSEGAASEIPLACPAGSCGY
jgi:hypothetical protein